MIGITVLALIEMPCLSARPSAVFIVEADTYEMRVSAVLVQISYEHLAQQPTYLELDIIGKSNIVYVPLCSSTVPSTCPDH